MYYFLKIFLINMKKFIMNKNFNFTVLNLKNNIQKKINDKFYDTFYLLLFILFNCAKNFGKA